MLRPNSEELIEEGNILAIEVPAYVQGVGGFAPEDILVVEASGNVLLSEAPAHLPECE